MKGISYQALHHIIIRIIEIQQKMKYFICIFETFKKFSTLSQGLYLKKILNNINVKNRILTNMLNLTHKIFNEFIKCNNIRVGIEDNGGQHPLLS